MWVTVLIGIDEGGVLQECRAFVHRTIAREQAMRLCEDWGLTSADPSGDADLIADDGAQVIIKDVAIVGLP